MADTPKADTPKNGDSTADVVPIELDDEVVPELVQESVEQLAETDGHLMSLETDPSDEEALGGVFRCFHTIKGLAGFLGFEQIEHLAHTSLTPRSPRTSPRCATSSARRSPRLCMSIRSVRFPALRERLSTPSRARQSASTSRSRLPAIRPAD